MRPSPADAASVTLYTRDPRIAKQVRALNAPGVRIDIPYITARDVPRRADIVLTMARLSGPVGLFAMRLGAMCVVLPEAYEWFSERIREGRYRTLVGADLMDASKL